MRSSSIQPLLLVGPLTTVAWVAAIRAEEPVSPEPSPPAASATVPVTPGRLHGGSYDPHARLDPETQIRIALRHKAEGRLQEALNVLSMAIDGHADQARLYAVRGSLLLEAGRITPALADLERAAKLDPIDAEALTNRSHAYRRFGHIDQALADLDRALKIAPDLLAARFNRGAMRYGTGDYRGALEDFDRCVALDPHLPVPYFNRASVRDARLGGQRRRNRRSGSISTNLPEPSLERSGPAAAAGARKSGGCANHAETEAASLGFLGRKSPSVLCAR